MLLYKTQGADDNHTTNLNKNMHFCILLKLIKNKIEKMFLSARPLRMHIINQNNAHNLILPNPPSSQPTSVCTHSITTE
jgi:hypothetical protein